MRKLLFMIICLLVMGVATADAQKHRSSKKKKSHKTVRVVSTQPKDTVVIFAFTEEQGMETTGVRLRRIGNDYMLTAILTEVIRADMDRLIASSRERTDEMLSNGRFIHEMERGDSIVISQIPGIEVKVPKSVADKVVQMAEEGGLAEMKSYYTTEEDERLVGGSWWSLRMRLPGKEPVSSGGRNGMGPNVVFKIYQNLFYQKVIYKKKTRKK